MGDWGGGGKGAVWARSNPENFEKKKKALKCDFQHSGECS